ncbi:MAG TPA: HTTM domain-containing protein, partial [Aggregicoccus sp.]|nr:HTTM domain-containing protein [Aggregicoccus sp.]
APRDAAWPRPSSRNPLVMTGTALPPNLLLAAKLLALVFILRGNVGRWFSEPYLPFLPALDQLGAPGRFQLGLQLAFVAAALCLFLNWRVRTASLVLGSAVLLGLLASRASYENSKLYMGLFYLVTALYEPRAGVSLLRYQLVVVYFGATLNKLLEPDWRSGAFVLDWLPTYVPSYPWLAAQLPGNLLSAALSWTAILTELVLIPLLLFKRLVPAGLVVIVAYHTGIVLLTLGEAFDIFWSALCLSCVALMQWPEGVTVRYTPGSRWHRLARQVLGRVDLEGRYTWLPQHAGRLQTELGRGVPHAGAAAFVDLLLYNPVVYVAFFLVTPRIGQAIPLVLPLLAVIVYDAGRRWWRGARAHPLRLVPRKST